MGYNRNLQLVGPSGQYGEREWVYTDQVSSFGDISASGFFNNLVNILRKGDMILVVSTDKINYVKITSDTRSTPVTTSEFLSPQPELISGDMVAPVQKYCFTTTTPAGVNTDTDFAVPFKFQITDFYFTMMDAGVTSQDVFILNATLNKAITLKLGGTTTAGDMVRAEDIIKPYDIMSAGDVLTVRTVDGGSGNSAAVLATIVGINVA